jgi:hypothetical protein
VSITKVMSRYEVEWLEPDHLEYRCRHFEVRDEAYSLYRELPPSCFPILRDLRDNSFLEPKPSTA